MSDAQLTRKYASQMELLFDDARTEAIKAAILDLDRQPSVPDFARLLASS